MLSQAEKEALEKLKKDIKVSHFKFGSYPLKYESRYARDYADGLVENEKSLTSPNYKTAKIIRTGGCVLGGDTLKEKNLQSVYQSYYKGTQNDKEEKLSKLHTKESRQHHYKFGFKDFGPGKDKTEAQAQFIDKQDAISELRMQTEESSVCDLPMSGVNNTLKSDGKNYFDSIYSKDYKTFDDVGVKPSQAEIKKKMLSLRCSNILLGCSDNLKIISENNDTYHGKKLNKTTKSMTNVNKGPGHIFLGNEKPTYNSTAHNEYNKKPLDPGVYSADVKKKMVSDFKTHHFKFGVDRPDYNSENVLNYHAKSLSDAKMNQISPSATKIKLVGGNPGKDIYSSTYNISNRTYDLESARNKPCRSIVSEQKSAIGSYYDKLPTIASEAHEQYKESSKIEFFNKAREVYADNHTNIDFGSTSPDYKSDYKNSYAPDKKANKYSSMKDIEEKLKKSGQNTHFKLGIEKNQDERKNNMVSQSSIFLKKHDNYSRPSACKIATIDHVTLGVDKINNFESSYKSFINRKK